MFRVWASAVHRPAKVARVGFGSCSYVLPKGARDMPDSAKRRVADGFYLVFVLTETSSIVPRVHIHTRRLATVTDLPASTSNASPSSASPKSTTSSKTPGGKPVIRSGIVLNRHPILTRTPTPLESAYYAYQSRIQRALYNPFPSEFYFKPGSLLQGKFEQEEIARERGAFGRMPWLDSSSSQKTSPASYILNQEDAVTPMARESEADRSGDVRSLDRKGERNLYLLVTSKTDGPEVWKFPQADLVGSELLHEVCHIVQQIGRAHV